MLYICFPFDILTSVALQGDSGSNMNYLKIYCAIGTGHMYLQLLEGFTGRHVGDCLLSCTACHVRSVVVVLLLDRHIYPCHSWPSLSFQSCWALFWYLVAILTRIFIFFYQRFYFCPQEILAAYPCLEPVCHFQCELFLWVAPGLQDCS